MSKELDALEKAKMDMNYHRKYERDYYYPKEEREKYFSIIENALKDYELMKQAKIIVADKKINDDDLEKLKNQIMFLCSSGESKVEVLSDEETQKKLKALEIIKNKEVNVQELFDFIKKYEEHNGLYMYNGHRPYGKRINEKEFDLLKEVLKMKYIRTKNGIYEIIDETENSFELRGPFEKKMGCSCTMIKRLLGSNEKPTYRLAETIDELCDEFVIAYENSSRIVYGDLEWAKVKAKASSKIGIKLIIYGAIWTEWGLKYIAKMNSKGELELL